MSTPETLHPYLDFAHELAAAAADLAVTGFRRSQAVRKFDGTLVTQTDVQVDHFLVDRIRRRYPEHGVLSEEQNTRFDPDQPYTWVLDPIDGTTNFARGILIWGVSVALLHHGTPVIGILSFPLLAEVYWAAAGLGAFRGDDPIHSAMDPVIDDEHLIVQCTRSGRLYPLNLPLKTRVLGSAAYHLAKVADGSAVAGIEATPKLWDIAAAWLILQEAGALLRTVTGSSIFPIPAEAQDYRSLAIPVLAAANQDVLDQVLAALRPTAGRSNT